jgi:hypothetical protein
MNKISIEDWNELRTEAFSMVKEFPNLRIGQCLFNFLYERNEELADSVRATKNDPFYATDYTDERIKGFFDSVVEQQIQVDDVLICKMVDRLSGNSIAPDLELEKEYPLKSIIICGCGNEHYDVGLVSGHNYVSCHSCKEHLTNGDKIHWCHPSRFVRK